MNYRIPYGGAIIGKEEYNAIMGVVDRNWWPMAEGGKKLEKEIAKYIGVKYAVLTNSGSSAGLLAMSALELPKGSEVIISAVTFPTIFNVILQCGLKPVVADANVGTYNIDPTEVEKLISKKTKAIWAIHAVGNPCDMVALTKIAKKHNLILLEDNCDGFGGSINGKKLGSWGKINITSTHAAHIFSTGQGGAVMTNDKQLARRAKMYRDWGRQADIKSRVNTKWKDLPRSQDPRFIYEKIGYNLLPLELQAAMGRVQLKKVEEIKKKRRANFDYIYEHLKEHPDLVMPVVVKGADPSWFSFPLTYTGDRGKLTKHLEKHGIETRSMFGGNILRHPAYKNLKCRKGNLEEANYILEHSLWVSCHPRMTQGDREYLVQTFANFLYAQTA